MIIYGIYNSDTLEALIDTAHRLHNQSIWNERLFVGKIEDWYRWYLSERGVHHYAINSLLFKKFITLPNHHKGNICKMYERFINQLKMYSQVIGVLPKGYLPISLLLPSKLNIIL